MDWVEKIRAWVYQIPFLKSIHFNFISKISVKILDKSTSFLAYHEFPNQLLVENVFYFFFESRAIAV